MSNNNLGIPFENKHFTATLKGKGFDSTILKAENISLSGKDINTITENKCNIIAYENLHEYTNIDQVLGTHGACVILYQLKADYGHWVSIFKVDNNTLEYFDSYGLPVDGELKFSQEHLRIHKGVITPHLTALIHKSNHGYKVIFNNIALQKLRRDENTCGRFAALRIRLRNIPLNRFVDLCTKNKCYNPSFWVSALTLSYSGFENF